MSRPSTRQRRRPRRASNPRTSSPSPSPSPSTPSAPPPSPSQRTPHLPLPRSLPPLAVTLAVLLLSAASPALGGGDAHAHAHAARETCPYMVTGHRVRIGGAPCADPVVASHAAQCPCLLHLSAAARAASWTGAEKVDLLVMTAAAWAEADRAIRRRAPKEVVDRLLEVAAAPQYSKLGATPADLSDGLRTWDGEGVAFIDTVDSFVVVARKSGRGSPRRPRCEVAAFAVLATVVPPPGIAPRDMKVDVMGPAVVGMNAKVSVGFRVTYAAAGGMCYGLDNSAHGVYDASAEIVGPGIGSGGGGKRGGKSGGWSAGPVGGKRGKGRPRKASGGKSGGDSEDEEDDDDDDSSSSGSKGSTNSSEGDGAGEKEKNMDGAEAMGEEGASSGSKVKISVIAAALTCAVALAAIVGVVVVTRRRRNASSSNGMSSGSGDDPSDGKLSPAALSAARKKVTSFDTEPVSAGESSDFGFTNDDGEGGGASSSTQNSVDFYKAHAQAVANAGGQPGAQEPTILGVVAVGADRAQDPEAAAREMDAAWGDGVWPKEDAAPARRRGLLELVSSWLGAASGTGGCCNDRDAAASGHGGNAHGRGSVMGTVSSVDSDNLSNVTGSGAPSRSNSWSSPPRTASNASFEPPHLLPPLAPPPRRRPSSVDSRNAGGHDAHPGRAGGRFTLSRPAPSAPSSNASDLDESEGALSSDGGDGSGNSGRAWRIWRRRPLPSTASAGSRSTGPVSGVSDFTPASIDSFGERSAVPPQVEEGYSEDAGAGRAHAVAPSLSNSGGTIDDAAFNQAGWMLPAPNRPVWRPAGTAHGR